MIWAFRALAALALLAIAGLIYEALGEARDAKRFPSPGRLVDIGGRRMHLLCEDDHPGPTVVIEQGAGEPSLLWRAAQLRIAAFARVCLYDRPGYQWSPSVKGARSLQARAEDLYALLEAAGVPGPYVLVAHSYGGLIVRLFARSHADAVAGAVMVDAADETIAFDRAYQRFAARVAPVLGLAEMAARLGVVRLWSELSPDREAEPESNPFVQGSLRAATVRPSFYAALADDLRSIRTASESLRAPGALGGLGDRPLVVVTHGQPFPGPFAFMERFWGEGQKRMLALSSDHDLVVAENSNHMIVHDQPDLVVEQIRRVVEAVRDGRRLGGQAELAPANSISAG